MGRMRLGDVSFHECTGHRQKARSVSWNSTGTRLASASLDRTAKIWSVEGSGQGREICNLGGHNNAVERVRWHPTDDVLCTAAEDRTVRLWDVRAATSSSSTFAASNCCIARIDLISSSKYGYSPASVEWHPSGRALAVAEKDNSVHVYDMRKLASARKSTSKTRGGGSSYGTSTSSLKPQICNFGRPIESFSLEPDIVQECHFSPCGNHLVAATKSSDGMGSVKIVPCSSCAGTVNDGSMDHSSSTEQEDMFVGHTGPIYCLRFSPCGMQLATGGADALVGLWDTDEMVCAKTIGRLNKLVRSVAFSHDSKLVSSSSEESVIDIADAVTGEKVGEVQARHGADELAWNPRGYALAFASGDGSIEGGFVSRAPVAHVTVVKLAISR